MLEMQTIDRSFPPNTMGVIQSTGESWDAALERYRRDAAKVLEAHTPSHAGCVACGKPWLCARAIGAAFTLEL
jgi:hypothetical protein